MRTNIVIDDDLMKKARAASGLHTKREVVTRGLEMLIRLDQQRSIRDYRGRLKNDTDVNELRQPE